MNNYATSPWWKKPLWVGLLVFLVLLLLTQFVAYQRYQLLRTTEGSELAVAAYNVEERLQAALNDALGAVQTLAFIVQNYGVPENFDSIAKRLLQTNRFMDALQLVNQK